jgi:hypothetical protein
MSTQIFSDQEWQTLHEEIERRFRVLAAEVARVAPKVGAEYGKTVTKRFPLFSHLSFNVVRGGVANDIIVGVDIGPEDGQWRIDADISDEEEGTVYLELPSVPFSVSSFEELQKRALVITDELIACGKPLLLQLCISTVTPPIQPFDSTASIGEDRRR